VDDQPSPGRGSLREAQLRDFVTVVETGGVRAAARQLGLSQSAISRNLASLERDFGVPLLLRSHHGIELTEFGRILLRRARVADAELRKAKEEIAALSGRISGGVRAWISAAAEAWLMAQAVEKFTERYPEVQLQLQSGQARSGITALREGRLDFVIGAVQAEGLPTDLKAEKLMNVELVAAARKGHPLARSADLASLASARWIFLSPSDSFEAEMQRLFNKAGLPPPRSSVQRESFSSLIFLLAQTDCVTITSRESIQPFCDSGMLAVLPVALEARPVTHHLVTVPARPLTTPAKFLAAEFQRQARGLRR
jgi:DNA-binding transcriptional LysR family regulator